MKLNLFLSFLFLLSGFNVIFSQPNTFLKIFYGYPHHHVSFCVAEDGDGGYISEFRGESYWYDDLLIKTDSVGNELLIDTLCGQSGISLKKTLDSNFVFLCTTFTPCSYISSNAEDYEVYKISGDLDTLWTAIFGSTSTELGIFLKPLKDSTYLIGGYSSGGSNVFKINWTGDTMWHRNLPMSQIFSGIEDSEENLVFCGYTDFIPNSWTVVKTDSTGSNILWAKYFGTTGGLGYERFYDLVQLPDSNYLIGGWDDLRLMKVDKNTGDSIWSEGSSGAIFTMEKTPSGKIIIGGDIGLKLLNDTGGVIWSKSLLNITLRSVKPTSDGGIICAGNYNPSFGVNYPVLLKTDSLGNFTTGIKDLNIQVLNYSLYPNPVTTESKLEFGNAKRERYEFALYDIAGREIENAFTNEDGITIKKENKPAGLYLFSLRNEKTGEVVNGKVVIQ